MRFDGVRILKGFIVFLILAIFILVIYFPNYSKSKKLSSANSDLENKISKLEDEISELQYKLNDIKTNSFVMEKIARESLGLAREGEIIVDMSD